MVMSMEKMVMTNKVNIKKYMSEFFILFSNYQIYVFCKIKHRKQILFRYYFLQIILYIHFITCFASKVNPVRYSQPNPPCLPFCSQLDIRTDQILYPMTESPLYRQILINVGNRANRLNNQRMKKKLKCYRSNRSFRPTTEDKTTKRH